MTILFLRQMLMLTSSLIRLYSTVLDRQKLKQNVIVYELPEQPTNTSTVDDVLMLGAYLTSCSPKWTFQMYGFVDWDE